MDGTGIRRQTARQPRSAVLVLALCLSLATGVALVGVGMTLADPTVAWSASSEQHANLDLARDFYAAVDEAIETGNANDLDTIVAPDVAWCSSCPGHVQTLAGLKAYLGDLHRTAPETRLIAESVIAGNRDTATVRVGIVGYPTAGPPMPWGPVDTLRVAGGLIVERRSGPDGLTMTEPLLGVRLGALPPATTGVVLARLIFAPGAGVAGLLSVGPTLVVVESGTLAVSGAGGGRVHRAGTDDGDATMLRSRTDLAAILRQGDAVIVPPGVRYGLDEQSGTESAVALGATLYVVDDGSDPTAVEWRNLPVFTPVDGPVHGSESSQARPRPVVRLLASGEVETWPRGPVRAAISRIVLGAGAHVVPSVKETALIAVDAGTLAAIGSEDPTVPAGSGVVRPAGAVRELRNEGPGVLVLLVLTIRPTDA